MVNIVQVMSLLLIFVALFLTIGYVLGLMLEACIKYQSTSRHVDVLHATAHFLRTIYTTAFTVHIESVKVGAGFTNITANLVQEVHITI